MLCNRTLAGLATLVLVAVGCPQMLFTPPAYAAVLSAPLA